MVVVLLGQGERDLLDQCDALEVGEVHLPVAGDQRLASGCHQVHASRTARPGSSLPSRNSRDAPPPVEMWVKPDSSMPRMRTAAAESPPPTTENDGDAEIASATARVPSAKGLSSKTPIGPFQNTVADLAAISENAAALSGPMSRPNQPSRMASALTICTAASAENASAITTSVGSTILSPFSASRFLHTSIWSSCSREAPTPCPWAARKVKAIPPPISSESTLGSSEVITPSLSDTFDPPRITAYGRSGSTVSFFSTAVSADTRYPAKCGSLVAIS